MNIPESMKKAVESLYDGICTITIMKDVVDPKTKITHQLEEVIYKDIPCRISHGKNSTWTDGNVSKSEQKAMLITSKDIEIPEGSKIMVTQQGSTINYHRSGNPRVYSVHQEVDVELFEGWR